MISALQVEKHPITTPGPLTMSPSAALLAKGSMGVYSAVHLAKGGSGSIQGSSLFTPYSGTPHGKILTTPINIGLLLSNFLCFVG